MEDRLNVSLLNLEESTTMSSQSVFKSLFPRNLAAESNRELAWKISMTLTSSGLKPFEIGDSLLSNLNHAVTSLVLSNPSVPIHRRLAFFKFLRTNEQLASKPDLQAHLTLAHCLFEARRFGQIRNLVNRVVTNIDLRCPVSDMVDLIEVSIGNGKKPDFVETFCDMLFRVYASNGMFEEAQKVFDFTEKMGISIEERSCLEVLIALKKSKMADSCLGFLYRMVERGIEVTVYSLTVAVDCLCRGGEADRAKQLLNDLTSRAIVKPNAFTYNSLLRSYIQTNDYENVKQVLSLMEKNNVDYNQVTYTLLIEWRGNSGEFGEARKLFEEMIEGGTEPDAYIYNSMIKMSCRAGDFKAAFGLFDELTSGGSRPGPHTYGVLVNGLCKAGQLEAAEILVNEMDCPNRVVMNTLMDGYCRRGLIDKAMDLKSRMEKEGLEIDAFCYSSLASGLCRLNRYEEAKRLIFAMEAPNLVTYTTLVNIYCKEGDFSEADHVIQEMERKGAKPNVVTYNAVIDGYCKKGKIKKAYRVKDKMGSNGIEPDLYTYTSLVHGECIAGNLDEALRLFDEMSEKGLARNVVTYTAMISGLAKEGRSDEAFKMYDEMIKMGLKPDNRVYALLVSSLHSQGS